MGTVVGGELLARASGLVEGLLGDLFTNRISIRIMEHAATLDLHQFEDPEFYDHLERARQGTTGASRCSPNCSAWGRVCPHAGVAQRRARDAGAVAPGPPRRRGPAELHRRDALRGAVVLVAVSLDAAATAARLRALRGRERRTAKEVQLFGLAPWLISRYRTLSERFYEENRSLAVKKAFVSSVLSLIGTLGYYGAYVVVLLRAIGGALTLGTLTFLAASFRQSRDLIQGLLMSASGIYEQSLYLNDLFAFFDMQPTIHSAAGARVPSPIQEGFVFEDVGFRYPGE